MYAIGMLAAIMLYTGTGGHVPEVVTGLIGVAFIIWAVSHQLPMKKTDTILIKSWDITKLLYP